MQKNILNDDTFAYESTIEDFISISLNHITNAYRKEKLNTRTNQRLDGIVKVLNEKSSSKSSALIESENIVQIVDDCVCNLSPKIVNSSTGSYLYISVYRTPDVTSIKSSLDDPNKNKTSEDSRILNDSDERDVYIFLIDRLRLQEFNVSLADKWVSHILALIQQRPTFDDHITIDHSALKMQRKKRLLIMVSRF